MVRLFCIRVVFLLKQAVGGVKKDKAAEFAFRVLFLHICSLLAGFFLSRTLVFSEYLPFGAATSAALKKEYTLSAGLGAVLGSIMTANDTASIRYVGSIIIAIIIKWILLYLFDKKNASLYSAISATIGMAAGAIMSIIATPTTTHDLTRFLCETLLAFGAAYFISISVPLINSGRKLSSLSTEELSAILFSVSIALMSISNLTIIFISPARIFAAVLIISAAKYGKETAGAICGIAFGLTISVISDNMYFIIGCYALSGLMTGIFSKFGNLSAVITFWLSNVALIAGFYSNYNVMPHLMEVTVAGTIFLILPVKLKIFTSDLFTPAPKLIKNDGLRRNIVMRLKFASKALTDVSDTVEEVSQRLSKINTPQLTDVFIQTENESCVKCGLRIHCFETLKVSTYEAFMHMTKTMQKRGKLNKEDYPEKWHSRCLNPDNVAASLYKFYSILENKQTAEKRISEVRSVVSDQMNGLSDMLYDMSDELNQSESYDTETAARIDASLRSIGIRSTNICCRLDAHRRMSVEICAIYPSDRSINKLEIIKRLSSVSGRKFDVPCVVNGGSRTLITVNEKANFRVDVGVAQYCYKNQKLCGDSYSYFNDGKGKTIMILSDGMGCGGRAAVDSAMVSGLISRLIKAGFGFECSLKLVNSAMLFKSTDESLATVDITAIDLFSGQADFYKAGTPETIVLKGQKIGRAGCCCYPAGILRNVEFDKTSTLLEQKDIILMMSDGACVGSNNWIEAELKMYKRASAQQIAEHIAMLANRRRNDGHQDDITVMVGIIENEI